jgi:tetratricopeptide (TPR) repeat protein
VTERGGEQRPEPLVREALDLFGEYQHTSDQPSLVRAVHVFRAALAAAVRVGVPDIAAYHNNLGYALRELAVATGDAAVQAESVRCLRAAVAATDSDDPDRVAYLCSLASGLRELYGYTGDAELLRTAVQVATVATESAEFEPSPATKYAVLTGALGDLYEHKADPAVLTELIAAYREAASYAELLDDPGLAAHWNSLGGWLRERYERTGDVGALTEGVRFSRKAVAATSGDKHLGYLSNLGDDLRLVFERTGDLGALAEAVAADRKAVAGTWPGNPDLPRRATNLSGALTCRYERTGEIEALAEAITAARQAVVAAAPGDAERGGYLSNLQGVLELEWERTGDLATLTESVRVARDAVAAAPPGHHLRAPCLTALASAVSELYDRTGDDELLAESVQVSRDALAALPAGDPDRGRFLQNLGQTLHTLFERTGDSDVLDEAVRVTREAIAATPADDPVLSHRLASLSSLLDDLAGRTGDAGPLTEAVETARAAVAAVPLDDPGRAALLDDLGAALTRLFVRSRNSAVLVEAVRVREEALAGTPDGHLSRITRLVNLAASVQTLAERAGDPAAAVDAVGLLREALGALPEDHPARALCLHNLARIYRALYRRFPQQEYGYFDYAIRCARESLAATPADHADHASRLATISGLLLHQWDTSQEPAPLAEALRLARQAVAATALDDPDYASHRNQLGWALFARHRAAGHAGGDAAAVTEAWQCFHDVGCHSVAAVGLRIGAYRRAAELAAEAGRTPQEALACIEAAVDLLPGVLPGQLDRADQEHEISSVTHLAAHAAEAAVTAGRPDRAVELLERTRGVLAVGELDRRAGRDHERPLTIRELGAIAADGPIVYVYVGVERCDALILTGAQDPAGAVSLVPLAVTEDDVRKHTERLLALVGTEPDDGVPDPDDPAAQREILAILDWLRDRVTGPVLAALGHVGSPVGASGWPRIWWCPVGEFVFLPLHAACLDAVVSSYVTTARGLRYARSQPSPEAGAASAPLVVAVPDAPDTPPLPGADLEASAIARAFPRALRLEHPTRKTVLAALPDHPVAHFACHGGVDVDEPSRSQLFLYDHADAPLTVADISALRLAGGLAFLSACETALTTGNLANEAVHITGAFQLAGYQHVVGTLWLVSDMPAVRFAHYFYAALAVPGSPGAIDVSRAAVALHHATRRLRDRYPGSPAIWAGRIHTGP